MQLAMQTDIHDLQNGLPLRKYWIILNLREKTTCNKQWNLEIK